MQPYQAPLVPTRFVWPYGGQRVLLCGSFTGWNDMISLSPVADANGNNVFAVTIKIPAGYHQFKVWRSELFLLDRYPASVLTYLLRFCSISSTTSGGTMTHSRLFQVLLDHQTIASWYQLMESISLHMSCSSSTSSTKGRASGSKLCSLNEAWTIWTSTGTQPCLHHQL